MRTYLVFITNIVFLVQGVVGSAAGGAFSKIKSPRNGKKGLSMKDRLLLLRGGSIHASDSSALPLTANKESSTSTSTSTVLNIVSDGAHWMTPTECLRRLGVRETIGLSNEEVRVRRIAYGSNSLREPEKKPLWKLVLEQFSDKLVQILLGVAIMSAVLASFEKDSHAFVEPVVIASALVINAFIGAYQGKSAEDSLDALKKLQPVSACVLRDGQWQSELPATDIVPGDIIYIRVGDKVPADARLIALKTTTFSTDESALTGESVTVSKSLDAVDPASAISGKTNMIFSGTMVSNGGAFAVVTSIGNRTEIGAIDSSLQSAESGKTPLTERLDEFGDQMGTIIGAVCVTVWLASIPKFSSPLFGSWLKGAIYHAKIAVALGVAAIPEGLPTVITLCLSLGTHRMAKRNVIVRKLSSVETLGCTSVICTDKTGTLTTNQMTVKSLVAFESDGGVSSAPTVSLDEVAGDSSAPDIAAIDIEEVTAAPLASVALKEHSIAGVSYEPVGEIDGWTHSTMTSNTLQDLATVCALCNEAELEYKEGSYGRIGEPTEAALKVLVEKMGVHGLVKQADPHSMIRQCNAHWASSYEKLAVLEFNRDRKSMSVLCRSKSNDENVLFVKGAAEVLVERCNRMKLTDGSIVPITPDIRVRLGRKLGEMARRPLRTLAMAYREGKALGDLNNIKTSEEASTHPLLLESSGFADIESDLVLVCCCGIKDPARPEAADAILKCTEAGVRVMMITGDAKETAVAIAKDVNIFDASVDVSLNAFTTREFFAKTEEEQLDLLRRGNKVFCRAAPKDKQVLISMLEKLGEVTAMTGDGVNDAPALKQADIGVAMGIAGTEVAKGAADMILADDNFATIVSAVEEGRNIYSNMQTFITFLISCNIGEIATVFLSTLMGLPEPLTPLHLLWVNLVTDGPPATALGFNPPDPDAMRKSPRHRHESILSPWLITRYVITGLYVGFATIGIFVWWFQNKGVSLSQLSNWSSCPLWTDFTHSASAPDRPDHPCDIFTELLSKPQTMSLSVLVVIELLKALSAVSLDNSLLRVQPWQNKWLIPGVLVPFFINLFVMYFPPLASVFGLAPLSKDDWKMVILFASPIVLLEELLKLTGRHFSRLKEIALSKLKEAQAQAQIQGRHLLDIREAAIHRIKEVQREVQAHTPHAPMVPPPMF